ncbi:MAG: hypothetical protein V7K25_21685 [Nostoc sp.]
MSDDRRLENKDKASFSLVKANKLKKLVEENEYTTSELINKFNGNIP